jgi:uncharacterized protein (DUF169 family)
MESPGSRLGILPAYDHGMESRIAEAIGAEYPPVALLFSDRKPEGAAQFATGKWGCVAWLLAGAFKGRTGVVDKHTYGCLGGGTGLGFGNCYETWPGGIARFYEFLSTGNPRWSASGETLTEAEAALRARCLEDLLHGEGYMKTPELVRRFVENLPITRISTRYVVFKPLSHISLESERPESVTFLVDPDRLSALVVLANYGRGDSENVIIPFGAGCQTVGIFTYREARLNPPRAVVGLTDLSVREHFGKQFGRNVLTFSIPFAMFEEMEANVAGSFLERPTWRALLAPKAPRFEETA